MDFYRINFLCSYCYSPLPHFPSNFSRTSRNLFMELSWESLKINRLVEPKLYLFYLSESFVSGQISGFLSDCFPGNI